MNKKTKLILVTLLVYGIPVILWSVLPFSKNLWGTWGDSTIFNFISFGNSVFRPIGIITDMILLYCLFILFFKKDTDFQKERVWLIYSGVKKIFKWVFADKMRRDCEISREEKISMLFYLVKLYFTPVMLNFLIGNWQALSGSISILSSMGAFTMDKENILKIYFPALLHVMLVIDTIIFSCGYLFESSGLKNIVKSVEPTAFGWLVTLACYPPVNDLTGRVLGWYTSDFSTFSSTNTTIIMGVVSLLLFSVYVWASIALGFKASNLTNRGIVTKGPYKYVRHPAYASKGISWLIMGIPFISKFGTIAVISLLGWTIIYFLRAVTEERHLSKDPDYVAYSQKVKYMFIPGII